MHNGLLKVYEYVSKLLSLIAHVLKLFEFLGNVHWEGEISSTHGLWALERRVSSRGGSVREWGTCASR